jgi:release factor glutamine methyltransferase
MTCYREWLSSAQAGLPDVESARLDAEVLLAGVLKKNRTHLFTWPERELTPDEEVRANALWARRLRGEPVAYLTGTRDFWNLSLDVNPSVLIPRPETELLVEKILAYAPSADQKVMDLGTGSGAIILALARERPDWTCWAVDREEDILRTARANARKHRIDNVVFLRSDWLKQVPRMEKFNLIVSNPPYIDPHDEHLKKGDLRFEPEGALVSGNKGLADIETISIQALDYLEAGGSLWFEHGYDQGGRVRHHLVDNGYVDIRTYVDLAGRERVTCAVWNK